MAPPAPAAAPKPAAPPLTYVGAKFSATLYGFVEFDSMYDSTQSYTDLPGNGNILRTGLGATHGRTTFAARNTRLGFRLKGPETETIKSSAMIEGDFIGNQPQGAPAPAGSPAVSEAAFYVNPTFRYRHAAAKLETPVVDILVGQYWQLFGWQSLFHPCTVELQGVPGQIYSRSPQIRLSHAFKSDDVTVEVALAASRPPQRDAVTPDGQGGLRVAFNKWKGLHTTGGAGTGVDPLSIGISGVARHFRVPELSPTPTSYLSLNSGGVSIDGLIPIVPASTPNDGNALTLTASYVYGQSIADLYTGLNGGMSSANSFGLPAGTMGTYPQDIDNGLVGFTPDGVLHPIRWQSVLVGLQYYFPTPIRMWMAANYSHMSSPNIDVLGSTANNKALWNKADWIDILYFVDATASIRFGIDYNHYKQTFLDGGSATNQRVGFSGFYIF